jgi:hypothetical protein
MALSVDNWSLSITIGIARMVQISSFASEKRGVYDVLIIYSEHVAIADTLLLVPLFSLISHFVSDNFSNVLNQDVAFFQSLLGE